MRFSILICTDMLAIKRKYTVSLKHYYLFLFVVVCFICFHLNNITIAGVKISELAMLAYLPLTLLYRSLHKYIIYLIFFFFVLLLITFIVNPFQEFFVNFTDVSILKEPYFITLSRFVEYLCCAAFLVFVYKSLLFFERKGISFQDVLQSVLQANVYFSWILILVFVLHQIGAFNAYSTGLYYSTMRLRGLYLEGGPYGLMYAFLFASSTLLPHRNRVMKATFLIIIVLTQSKAGLLLVFLWVLYTVYRRTSTRYFIRPLVLIAGISVSVLVGLYAGKQYIDTAVNIEKVLAARGDDTNITMGRVSGIFITPRMIVQNPVLGVGLGNYAIVRNDPDYRGSFPPVDAWDLPGLGGLVVLIAEGGFLSFLLLITILTALYREVAPHVKETDRYLYLFLLLGMLGVQLYFPYVWLPIGILIFHARRRTLANAL